MMLSLNRMKMAMVGVAFGAMAFVGTACEPVQGVTPGAFCKEADAGRTGYTVDGVEMVCSTTATDDRYRWRAVK